MKVLIYDNTDPYGGGSDIELIVASTDESKLEAKRIELLELSKAVDAAHTQWLADTERWKAECEQTTRQFLQRNRDAIRDLDSWQDKYDRKRILQASRLLKIEVRDAIINDLCHIRWLMFVGQKSKMIAEYLDADKLTEPMLVLPHQPLSVQAKSYTEGSFYVSDVEEV